MNTPALLKPAAFTIALVLMPCAALLADEAKTRFPSIGKVERLDPAFDQLVPADAKLEKLAEGFEWSEGPVWVKDGSKVRPDAKSDTGFLLFSDIPNNVINRWTPAEGIKPFLKPAGYTGAEERGGEMGTNGLTLDPDGRLVMCQHGDRRVARLKPDGSFETLADRWEGKRFNSPNDLTYDSKGNLFFTDPPYGLEKTFEDPAKELDFQGVYRLGKDGKLTLLTKELRAPNGITLSPDEKTLYVANSDPDKPVWMAFDLKDDGTVANGRVFFDATKYVKEKRKGLPDGLKTDTKGNLWATGPGGVFVLTPAGKLLGIIDPGEATANCGFGGDDGSTLYMTSDMNLCRIKTNAKGRGF